MIPLMKQAFFNEEQTKLNLANFVLNTNQFSMGEKCFEFEKQFSEWHGMNHGILVNSGASANLALLQALKNLGRLKGGDRIGFSAVTWSTNVMPIIQMGFIPVPIDCDTITLNVMSDSIPYDVECLFLTNVLGFAGDLDNINKICDEHDIILLEDNCEALGTELKSGKTGTFGLASTFSFFVGHHLSTIEGGMILTNDPELADMLRLVRANGWDRNVSDYCKFSLRSKYNVSSEFQAKYTFYDLAFNIRPTEITGFLGLEQMKYLDEMVNKRERNFLVIKNHKNFEHLKKISAFAIPFLFENRENYLYCFQKNGIEVRPIIAGNITKQPFWKKYVNQEYYLPGADYIHRHGFYCANRPDLTEEEIALIVECAS